MTGTALPGIFFMPRAITLGLASFALTSLVLILSLVQSSAAVAAP